MSTVAYSVGVGMVPRTSSTCVFGFAENRRIPLGWRAGVGASRFRSWQTDRKHTNRHYWKQYHTRCAGGRDSLPGKLTRSSAIAGRPCDAKACQWLLKWTWKCQPRLKWPSNVPQGHQKWHQSKVYDFLLVVYSNFCRITHPFWEIWCETVQWPWNMPKVIDSCITWKLSCGHVCKMFGRQWRKQAKIAIFNYPNLIWCPLSSEPPRISA